MIAIEKSSWDLWVGLARGGGTMQLVQLHQQLPTATADVCRLSDHLRGCLTYVHRRLCHGEHHQQLLLIWISLTYFNRY